MCIHGIVLSCGFHDFQYTVINCGQPSSPINGMVNVTTTTITSLAFYYCDEGFRLSGEDTRVCQASGFWRERDPTCEGVMNINFKIRPLYYVMNINFKIRPLYYEPYQVANEGLQVAFG